MNAGLKAEVHDFWDAAACGEELYLKGRTSEDYTSQARQRYELEPYILTFLRPQDWGGKRVLEIGVGLGADHQKLAEAGAVLSGIDLTERAVSHTRQRLRSVGLDSDLQQGDAENLSFADGTFDLVYSWGVIHHSPNTKRVAEEILRVLKPGGHFRVMVYHTQSLVGFMLWARYALAKGKPFTSLATIYSRYLESPGTKAYASRQAPELFNVPDVSCRVQLTHGDLLEGGAGQRHEGRLLAIARVIWPRWLLRRVGQGLGLFLLIQGTRPRS